MKRLTNRKLNRIIKESVNKVLSEAVNGGWTVETSEAQEAYELAIEHLGQDQVNEAIVRSLSDKVLAESLAYIFRMYDFREWESRYENEEEY